MNGVVLDTFKQECVANDLVNDNQVWHQIMLEAVDNIMPHQMRNTFANLLVFANVMDPLQLWEEFRDSFCEDYTHRGVPVERAYLEGLADIHFVLCLHGFTLSSLIYRSKEHLCVQKLMSNKTLMLSQMQCRTP